MYRPGKEILLADALSHLPSRTDTEIKLDLRVDAISMSAFIRTHLVKIAAETQRDPNPFHSIQIDIKWLVTEMHQCTQNSQKLL